MHFWEEETAGENPGTRSRAWCRKWAEGWEEGPEERPRNERAPWKVLIPGKDVTVTVHRAGEAHVLIICLTLSEGICTERQCSLVFRSMDSEARLAWAHIRTATSYLSDLGQVTQHLCTPVFSSIKWT